MGVAKGKRKGLKMIQRWCAQCCAWLSVSPTQWFCPMCKRRFKE